VDIVLKNLDLETGRFSKNLRLEKWFFGYLESLTKDFEPVLLKAAEIGTEESKTRENEKIVSLIMQPQNFFGVDKAKMMSNPSWNFLTATNTLSAFCSF